MATQKQNAINMAVTIGATSWILAGGTTPCSLYVHAAAHVDQDLRKTAKVKFASLTTTAGATINEFSTDGTLAGNSDTALPTEQAVKTYVDAHAGVAAWTTKNTGFNAAVNNCYFCNGATLITAQLASNFAVGAYVRLAGQGVGGYKVKAAAGDTIKYGNLTTKAAGYIQSGATNDCIYLVGMAASSAWEVLSSVGNFDVEIS